jgi:hypothetical protein
MFILLCWLYDAQYPFDDLLDFVYIRILLGVVTRRTDHLIAYLMYLT